MEERIIEATLLMVNNVVGVPIEGMTVDELRAHRKAPLEPMGPEATAYLKGRHALLAKDGTERPELIALEDRIIACTLLLVTRAVNVPMDQMKNDEVRTHRAAVLEPMMPEATDYLSKRKALLDKDGETRKELIQLEERIIEATLLMVNNVVGVPIEGMTVDELRAHRKAPLEPMGPEATAYLKGRHALLAKDGTERPELIALEDRILETTLAMVERVIAIPLDPLDIDGLLKLRAEGLEPMQLSTTTYLASRRAEANPKDGQPWQQLVALEARIIEATLLTTVRLVVISIDEMEIAELNAFRTQKLEPRLDATVAYLSKRGALHDPSTADATEAPRPRKEIVALEDKIQTVKDRVRDLEVLLMLKQVAELVAKPIDELTVPELNLLRTKELEPMVARAMAYLAERAPMHLDPKTGKPWAEMRSLDERILEVIERVRFLEVAAMLKEVAQLAEQPIDGMDVPALHAFRTGKLEPMVTRATDYLNERDWLLLDGVEREEMRSLAERIKDTHRRVSELESLAMLTQVANAANEQTEGVPKEALKKLRTATLEVKLKLATEYLQERGWLSHPETVGWSSTEHSRDEARPQAGELHAEMMALQTKIKDVIAREISLMLREVTLSCDHEDDGKTVAQLNEYREKTLEPKEAEATAYLEEREALLLSSGKTRPEMNQIALRIQEVKDRVLRMEVREILDEIAAVMAVDLEPMKVAELTKHADDVLEPVYVKATNFLSERGVLLERGNRERPQLVELAERISYIPQRVLHLEVESTLSDINEKVARPLEALSAKELTTMRSAVLQPTLDSAKSFLDERGVLRRRGLRQVFKLVGAVLKIMPKVVGETGPDGEPVTSEDDTDRPEIVALEARIEETIVRSIELTIGPLMAEMVAATSLEPKTRGKDDLHALRTKELEPLVKRGVPFLEKEGGLESRIDGSRRPELVALEARIAALLEEEIGAICRDMLIAVAMDFYSLDIEQLAELLANELEPALSDGVARLEALGAAEVNGGTRSEILSLRGRIEEVRGRKAELEAIKAAKEAAEAKRKMQLKRWSKAEASAIAEVRAEAERRAYAAKVAAEEAAKKAAEEKAAADEAERIERERLAEIERKKREAREALERERKARMTIPEVTAARVAPKAKDMLSKIMPKREMLQAGQKAKGRLGMHAVLDLAQAGVPQGAGHSGDAGAALGKSTSAGVLPPVRGTRTPMGGTRFKGALPVPRGYNADPFAAPPRQPAQAFGDTAAGSPAHAAADGGGSPSSGGGGKSPSGPPVREAPRLLTGKMSMSNLLAAPPSMRRSTSISTATMAATAAGALPHVKGADASAGSSSMLLESMGSLGLSASVGQLATSRNRAGSRPASSASVARIGSRPASAAKFDVMDDKFGFDDKFNKELEASAAGEWSEEKELEARAAAVAARRAGRSTSNIKKDRILARAPPPMMGSRPSGLSSIPPSPPETPETMLVAPETMRETNDLSGGFVGSSSRTHESAPSALSEEESEVE